MKSTATTIALALASALLIGCQPPVPVSQLDGLEDAAGDGFVDVAPPQGVVFEETTNVSIRLRNTIDKDDLADLARTNGFDPDLLNLVTVVASATIVLDYGEGMTDSITDHALIEPFEKSFEFACPDSAEARVQVEVIPPVGEPYVVFESEGFEFVGEIDFTCGETIAFESFLDESGFPNIRPIES